MLRTFLILLFFSITLAKAQTFAPASLRGYSSVMAANNTIPADSLSKKKWFISKYAGISTSFSFLKGGSASIFAVPLSLQLNRRLNENLYAFANVSIAPAYTNFNGAFVHSNFKSLQQNGFNYGNKLGVYSAASLGLMYVNDNKTFSISGSISVERSSNPMMPVYGNYLIVPSPNNNTRYK